MLKQLVQTCQASNTPTLNSFLSVRRISVPYFAEPQTDRDLEDLK